ncbi:hypothetical protein, partial [Paraburkholderia sp. BR14374]|uniref:hypothetical protein n=1 Tax=Paraburkholderia sp. BR14374 TaxID=3237007 RepID=UPI0034CF3A51
MGREVFATEQFGFERAEERLVSRIGVIEPGMIGVMRPPGMAPKRDFEGTQECVFLPDFATAF